MQASELIKILSLCPAGDVLVWCGDRAEDVEVIVDVNDGVMSFVIEEVR